MTLDKSQFFSFVKWGSLKTEDRSHEPNQVTIILLRRPYYPSQKDGREEKGTDLPGLQLFKTILASKALVVLCVCVECMCVCMLHAHMHSRVNFGFSATFSCFNSPGPRLKAAPVFMEGLGPIVLKLKGRARSAAAPYRCTSEGLAARRIYSRSSHS
jgi:hypothetical protein